MNERDKKVLTDSLYVLSGMAFAFMYGEVVERHGKLAGIAFLVVDVFLIILISLNTSRKRTGKTH